MTSLVKGNPTQLTPCHHCGKGTVLFVLKRTSGHPVPTCVACYEKRAQV